MVRTITIDMEAYTLLAGHKQPGQSFSQVIKAHFGAAPTAGRLLARLRAAKVSPGAIDGMEQQVQARRAEPARAVKR